VATPFDRSGKPEVGVPGILGPIPQDSRTTGLTYEPFYGLKEKPFSLTSDARFFYQSRSHAPAYDNLLHAIKRRESLTVLTGDIGTGKTTLCRAVLQNLDRKTFSAFVADPFASREELLKVLLTDFGVASVEDLTSGRLRNASRTELSYLLYDFLGTLAPLQAFAAVFIDEAQNLSLPLLEEIRILSDADGQLQVVLVGQLEFREKLTLPQMRQLDQRVSVHCRLEALDLSAVAGYIAHRLHRAGGSADRVTFSSDAVERIYELSGGVPRIINKLCDRALHTGYLRKVSILDIEIVDSANPDVVPPPREPVIAPVSLVEMPAPMPPAVQTPIAINPAPVSEAPPLPPLAASPPPPMAPPAAEAPVARRDSVDKWLAGIQDKAVAAAAAKALKPPLEAEEPSAWRNRWAPTDAVSPLEQQRLRYRVRIGNGPTAAERETAPSSSGSRQFAAVLVAMTALALAALAGPPLIRGAARFVRHVNAQFSPPPVPNIPGQPARRVALPPAPQLPDGPY